MTKQALVARAIEAMGHSYSPYSHFCVGAALLTKSGKVYEGCNIENAAFTPTNCAERTAFFKAVYDGEREFTAIAVAGGIDGKISGIAAPCGVCRQVMQEFCGPEFLIHMADRDGAIVTVKLPELLPYGFGKNDLNRGEDSV